MAREEHRAAYVRAAIELSLLHCEGTACGPSAAALARALRADPYLGENYHQKLMTCLEVVEGKYAAVEHYRRLLRFLREELDDSPLEETRTLAEEVRAGRLTCRRGVLPREVAGDEPALSLNCPLTPDGRRPGPLGQLLELG